MNPETLLKMEKGLKVNKFINLKVGPGKAPGYSVLHLKSDDIDHDIEDFPYPLDDQTCETVLLDFQMCKIKPWLQIEAMNEFHRLLVVGGLLLMNMPYGLNKYYIQDPENCSSWDQDTPLYFCPEIPPYRSGTNQAEPSPNFLGWCKPWELCKSPWNRHYDMKIGMRKI